MMTELDFVMLQAMNEIAESNTRLDMHTPVEAVTAIAAAVDHLDDESIDVGVSGDALTILTRKEPS